MTVRADAEHRGGRAHWVLLCESHMERVGCVPIEGRGCTLYVAQGRPAGYSRATRSESETTGRRLSAARLSAAPLPPMSVGGLQPPCPPFSLPVVASQPVAPALLYGHGLLAPGGRYAAGRSQAAVKELAGRPPLPTGNLCDNLPDDWQLGSRHRALLPNTTGRGEDRCLVRALEWQPPAPGQWASLSSPGRAGPRATPTGAGTRFVIDLRKQPA